MDIIETKGMDAIAHLEEALREDYEWLAKIVDESMGVKEFRQSETFMELDNEKVHQIYIIYLDKTF
jgi:hypothetical protein